MASHIKLVAKYTATNARYYEAVRTGFRQCDIKVSTKRKPPRAEPKPYLKLLRMDFGQYLKVECEDVMVDDTTPGQVFNVYTGGGSRGAQFVDTWAVIPTEEAPHGCVALGSARTPWAIWVSQGGDFERNTALGILKATGIKHPARCL